MELKKEQAKQIYEHVPAGFKKLLETEFGPEAFRRIDFKDLKIFEDLCKANDTTGAEFEAGLKDLPISQAMKTTAKFELMSEAFNPGWRPDTLDTTQKKWFPIFTVSSSGLGFLRSYCYFDYANASVGFPFCFKNKEQSDHSGQQFIALWEELILRKIV